MSKPNPYVGPRAFKTGEKIYGRDTELRDLLDLLIAERIVLMHSPSGAGKTSLINAGLIPRLEEESFQMHPTVRVNLEPPVSLLKETNVNRYVLSVLLSLEEALQGKERSPLEKLAAMRLGDYLDQCPREASMPESEVLIFDQFEEILSLMPTDQEAKAEFFTQVGEALRSRKRWALFSMREDYVASLDPFIRAIPTRLRNTFRLDRLDVRAARQAIRQPAEQAGVDFESKAAQLLVDDLRRVRVQLPDGSVENQLGPYVEPVQLQVVCYRLWENRDSGGTQISETNLKAIGDVNTALADYYAEQIASVSKATLVSERVMREWFDRQLITEQGIRSQVLMGPEKSGGLANPAIRMLEDAHLVRAEKRGGATWFELSHDRLIEPLRQDNAAWVQKNLNLLQRTAEIWNRQERPDSLLLRDKDLIEAEAWAEDNQNQLLPFEQEFLTSGQEARAQEQHARAMAEQAIELQAERKRAQLQVRLTRIIAAIGALAVILAIIAGILAVQSNQNAQSERTQRALAVANASTAEANEDRAQVASTDAFNQKETAVAARLTEASAKQTAVADRQKAEAASTMAVAQEQIAQTNARVALSRRLASLGLSYLSQQPNLAFLFDVEAYQSAPTFEALNALYTGLQRSLNRRIDLYGRQPPIQGTRLYSVAFSPDGRTIAWSGTGGVIGLWDVQEGRLLGSRIAHDQKTVYSVVFSPQGDILASGGADGKISLWNPDSLEPTGEFHTQLSFVLSLAFSPDGNTLASSGIGRRIFLWDIPNNRFLRTLSPPFGDDVWSVAWSPDGKFLASGGADEIVRVWDPQSAQELESFTDIKGTIFSVAWSPDNQLLAAGGENLGAKKENNIYLWDISTKGGTPLVGHTDKVLSLAFSEDGKTLASAGADHRVLLWDVQDQKQINQISDRTHWIQGLAFNLQGKQKLAAVGLDRLVNIYEIVTEQPLSRELTTGKRGIQDLVFTGDNALKIGANQSGKVILWDLDMNKPEEDTSQSLEGEFSLLALSRNGSTLALGKQDGVIHVLDIRTNEIIAQFQSTGGPPLSMALSPDGRVLAAGVCVQRDEELQICTQNDIDLWDTESGAYLRPIHTTHTDEVISLAFSPDGLNLVSGSKDHKILFWDVDEDAGTASSVALTGHLGGITSLAFSRDGAMLASGDETSQLILWDIASHQPIGEPTLFSIGALEALAFSEDQNVLAIGSIEGNVLLMDTDPQSWLDRACELAGRNFSETEWRQFFPDQAYHQTCPQFPVGTPTPTPSP